MDKEKERKKEKELHCIFVSNSFFTLFYGQQVLGQTNQSAPQENRTNNFSSQNVNSSNSLQQSTAPSIAADIYGVTAFAVFVLAVLRFRIRKSILRAILGIILLFLSLGLWIQLANQGGHILALIVILFALGIVLSKRKKKIYQWKKYDKPRRYFSAVVRDQVIKDQKYKCANCGVGISDASRGCVNFHRYQRRINRGSNFYRSVRYNSSEL
jgi:hypothetical protein